MLFPCALEAEARCIFDIDGMDAVNSNGHVVHAYSNEIHMQKSNWQFKQCEWKWLSRNRFRVVLFCLEKNPNKNYVEQIHQFHVIMYRFYIRTMNISLVHKHLHTLHEPLFFKHKQHNEKTFLLFPQRICKQKINNLDVKQAPYYNQTIYSWIFICDLCSNWKYIFSQAN